MAFCSNCGTRLADNARFCVSCGTPVNGTDPTPRQEPPASGIRTTEEVLDFFAKNLGMKAKYKERYRKGVDMLIHNLMPDEVIEFATCAVLDFATENRVRVCIAATNQRFLIAYPEDTLTSLNNTLKGRRTMHGVHFYNYSQISHIDYSKGLLVGSVDVDIMGSTMSFGVDKPFVDTVYTGLRSIFEKYV